MTGDVATLLLLVGMCVFMGAVIGHDWGAIKDAEQDAADDAEWVEYQAWLAVMRADVDVTVIGRAA